MSETWKDVKGSCGKYKVSDKGNVLNVARNKLMKQETLKNGYKRLTLQIDGSPKKFQIHRLVAETFLPNPDGYPCVNHKDENRSNNDVSNLEWCTYSYNINYGNRNFKLHDSAKSVKQMDFSGNVLATYCSATFAAKMLGVDASNIYKCCRHEMQYAYEYKWEYV